MNRFTKLAKDAIAKNGHRCFATQTVQVPKTTQDFAKMLKTAAIEGVKTSANLESGRKQPVRVAVTGAAGQIGYSLLPRIANGEMLGKDQPVILHLLERPEALKALDGVVMELQDCAFPLLHGVVPTSDMAEGFSQVDYALLVGAKPRGPGMERADVLKDNAKIFQIQGKALSDNAKSDCLVLVVGNPANTNAYILSKNAPKLDPKNITAMTRLDQDRALAQLAIKSNCNVDDIDRISIWGNHSATQYPDLFHTTIKGDWARSKINNDEKWIREHFIPTVQKRGAAIIAARGLSSAASAADAAIKHMHDWVLGSGKWVSMAIRSDGSYGVPEGIWSSFPVKCSGGGDYVVVDGLPIDEFAAEKINASITELIDEQKTVDSLLK